jgi:hypothetical protein
MSDIAEGCEGSFELFNHEAANEASCVQDATKDVG